MAHEMAAYSSHELRAGLKAQFEVEVTERSVADFASVSGDSNPLHVDEEYARSTNFEGRIVHGAYQVGLASAMAGMYLPGRDVLLASINSKFPKPLYYPCRVRVTGEITNWNPRNQWGTLRVVVTDLKRTEPTAEITVGFTLHDRKASVGVQERISRVPAAGRPTILVTGASGGLGARLVESLASNYHVVAVRNRAPLPPELADSPAVSELPLDLLGRSWEMEATEALSGAELFGVIHAAWPGAPRGSLLDVPDETVAQQVLFGSSSTIRLARWFARSVASGGGRMIVVSSVAGSMRPALAMSAYSLGKSTLDQTVKLLAPELARRSITLNAISPGFIPVGINRGSNDRRMARERAIVPMGRVCEPADVLAMCEYLLSPRAGFVSGQIIGLTGAQL